MKDAIERKREKIEKKRDIQEENQRMNKCKCFTHPPAFYLHHLKQ